MTSSIERTIRQTKKGIIPLDEAVFFILGAINTENIASAMNELYPELKEAVIAKSSPEAANRWPILSTDDTHLREAAKIVWRWHIQKGLSTD